MTVDVEHVIITEVFATCLAGRLMDDDATWSGFSLGLGRSSVARMTTDERVTLADLAELQAAENTGYARASGTWSVSLVSGLPVADLAVDGPAWENTGEADWQAANCLFLVGTLDGELELCAVWGIEAFALPAGDSLEITDDRVRLRFGNKQDKVGYT